MGCLQRKYDTFLVQNKSSVGFEFGNGKILFIYKNQFWFELKNDTFTASQ